MRWQRCSSRDPGILLLDEPTKGMDNFFKIKFAGVLRRLRERGVTVIMVSHDVEFCAGYADFMGMIFDGEMVAADTPADFLPETASIPRRPTG